MSTKYPGGFITKSPVAPSLAAASGIWSLDQAEQNIKANTWPLAPTLLTRSLRFRQSATAYLNRTVASTSSTTTWTWSGWYKRGALATGNAFFSASNGGGGSGYWCQMVLNASDQLSFIVFSGGVGSISGNKVTTAVYRDPSAWYHIVFVFNTTSATAEDRMQIWVNGVRVTAWDTNTLISQNFAGYINNSTYVHELGALYYTPNTNFVDGYMAEVNFIDGQALTPSSFGAYDGTTGVWQPAHYNGTYGTNGFYLPFTNITSTTTLGYDSSGNGNNWTTNNISLTSGVTYDSMTDVPTLTSATAANFAVLNPLFIPTSAGTTNATLTSGNLQFVGNATTDTSSRSTIGVTSGKWYCEVLVSVVSANQDGVGIAYTQSDSTRSIGVIYRVSGDKCVNNTVTAYGTGYAAGSLIGIALDADASTVTFYNNNVSQGAISFTPTTAIYFSTYGTNSVSSFAGNINFGQRPFSYTPPSGFVALNTYNLPASTVPNGAAYMAATTYTGTLLSNTIANTVGSASFQPDFVWIKSRSAATDNKLTDSVRGVTKGLISNTTGAETTDTQGLTAFGSTGFTVGTNTDYNNLAATYVAWQWKGGGTAVSNTNGSITSSVSANTTSGFSVIKYISNGTNGATVGHGLGVAPSLVIVKCTYTGTTQAWAVYHASLGATKYLTLQSTDAATTSSAYWNNTAPSSSVFTIGTSNDVNINSSVYTYAAYCFAAIKGFSAFGSYTGNYSADGPFVYTGFKPRFILIKCISTPYAYDWEIIDTTRSTYNSSSNYLQPNLSNAEYSTTTDNIDILSNGFKIRTVWTRINDDPGTFIYAAFAENPFQNSLAR